MGISVTRLLSCFLIGLFTVNSVACVDNQVKKPKKPEEVVIFTRLPLPEGVREFRVGIRGKILMENRCLYLLSAPPSSKEKILTIWPANTTMVGKDRIKIAKSGYMIPLNTVIDLGAAPGIGKATAEDVKKYAPCLKVNQLFRHM